MGEFYKATSPKNPDRLPTEEVVLARDDKGNATKSVVVGGDPVELSPEEHKTAGRFLNLRKSEENVQESDDEHNVQNVDEDEAIGTYVDPENTTRGLRRGL